MKSFTQIFCTCIVCLALTGCRNTPATNQDADLPPLSEWSWLPSDSLSDYQKELRVKIADILAFDVTVENDSLILDLTPSEFAEKGVPAQYYDEIVAELNKTTEYAKSVDWSIMSEGSKNLKEAYEESMRSYIQRRDEWFSISDSLSKRMPRFEKINKRKKYEGLK